LIIGSVSFDPVSPRDVDSLREFLTGADLTLAGLDAPAVRLWVERDITGALIGSTGYELSADGKHALIRSVAVAPDQRGSGAGSRLAMHALMQAAADGAGRAWLFSRRSGPFWQSLGFQAADRYQLAAALPDTHQVQLFTQSGQLAREIAWSRPITELVHYADPQWVPGGLLLVGAIGNPEGRLHSLSRGARVARR
jgi:N-acetylglutamate synthase-like GNAT family acetyltransferase